MVTGGNTVVDMHAWLSWVEGSGLASRIRDSLYIFPFLEAIHVIGLSFVFGTIVILDLRLLGMASSRRPVSRIVSDILAWTWLGFAVTAVTGSLMFSTNALVYFDNVYFRIKIALLVLAGLNMVAFELTARRTIGRWDLDKSAPAAGKAVAAASLVIWIGVIFAGRMIGFTTSRATVKAPSAPTEEINFDDLLGVPADSSAPAPTPAPAHPAPTTPAK